MPRITHEDLYTETYENENFKIVFVQPYKGSITRGYKVHDKVSGEDKGLLIEMPQEQCYNLNGEIKLTFQKGEERTKLDAIITGEYYHRQRGRRETETGNQLYALRPKAENRPEGTLIVGDERKYNPETGFYELRPSINGIMSIYKGLQDGLFREGYASNEATNSSQAISKEILEFMDKYIFNNSESKELLNEYLSSFENKKENMSPPEAPKKGASKSFLTTLKSRFTR